MGGLAAGFGTVAAMGDLLLRAAAATPSAPELDGAPALEGRQRLTEPEDAALPDLPVDLRLEAAAPSLLQQVTLVLRVGVAVRVAVAASQQRVTLVVPRPFRTCRGSRRPFPDASISYNNNHSTIDKCRTPLQSQINRTPFINCYMSRYSWLSRR